MTSTTMISRIASFQEEFGASIAALAGALAAGDERRFFDELDVLVQRREVALFGDLQKLTNDLRAALQRFRVDSQLVKLAEKEVPNARHRLDHVLTLTDAAAHRTMDLVEQCMPLAERTSRQADEIVTLWQCFRSREIEATAFRDLLVRMDAFLKSTHNDMDKMRNNLAEVVLAQGYQDLSGQIIRGVIRLVGELEIALAGLVRLSRAGASRTGSKATNDTRCGYGPAVPGVNQGPAVSDQEGVDDLLSGLGR